MKKSDKLMTKSDKIVALLNEADYLQQQLFAEFETEGNNNNQCYEIHNNLENLIDEFGEIAYEFVMPIQMEEDEKENEISQLKKRIFELKSSMEG